MENLHANHGIARGCTYRRETVRERPCGREVGMPLTLETISNFYPMIIEATRRLISCLQCAQRFAIITSYFTIPDPSPLKAWAARVES